MDEKGRCCASFSVEDVDKNFLGTRSERSYRDDFPLGVDDDDDADDADVLIKLSQVDTEMWMKMEMEMEMEMEMWI
ncbi:hypothetical protein EYC80_000226 [Monilinia laxa]|uniref:Uncharacterized protein n=1 Tax=Monilinia laxa TaxID=61186 RepID=A0A5N6K9Z6_MONLA|nr:hypothetical protein EYC80_000226 [Monilinia laxa]